LVDNEHRQYSAEHDEGDAQKIEMLQWNLFKGIKIAWPEYEENNTRN
jgi:hypothetical protein